MANISKSVNIHAQLSLCLLSGAYLIRALSDILCVGYELICIVSRICIN